MRGYAICGAQRSGSYFLCDILASTGKLGRPDEFFNVAIRQRVDPNYPADPTLQAQKVLTDGATENGIYALKIFPDQFTRLQKTLRLSALFPDLKYVRLRRRDMLGQALSWARATQTGQWRSDMPARGVEPSYNSQLILERLTQLTQFEAAWDFYFARTGFKHLSFVYEDLVQAPQAYVDQIAAIMEVTDGVPIDPALLRLDVQRDPMTEIWRSRFIREYGNPDIIHKV